MNLLVAHKSEFILCREVHIAHAVQISWLQKSCPQLLFYSNHCHLFVFLKFDGEQAGCDWALHLSLSSQACEADIII